jgi:hypothetical protein
MELAGRVFDVVTKPENLTDEVRDLVPEVAHPDSLAYWKRVLRMAALCHDVGHLPFSHAAEQELLPKGVDHEALSRMLIESEQMRAIWEKMMPPLTPEHIVKLAVGAKHAPNLKFTKWESILSEIIVGNAFGVDRIDYLLRDSYHTGVAYGRFDHYRLIDELRIVPSFTGSTEPALGINIGGIYSAESMALARYFMFSQVYYHPIRLIYDRHLQDFLTEWLAQGQLFGGTFPTDVDGHLRMTDNEVNTAIRAAAFEKGSVGHAAAQRIIFHHHFKVLYERNPQDSKLNSEPGAAIREAAIKEFGLAAIRYSKPGLKTVESDFPVRARDGRIEPAISVSEALSKLKPSILEYVYVDPDIEPKAVNWLKTERDKILKKTGKKEDEA